MAGSSLTITTTTATGIASIAVDRRLRLRLDRVRGAPLPSADARSPDKSQRDARAIGVVGEMIAYRVSRGWVMVAVATAVTLAATAPAHAQTATIERFRAECRKQFADLRGPDQQEVAADHVRDCVQTRMQALGETAEASPANADQPVHLTESTAWLVGPTKGPARAKGVIYFVAGYSPARPMIDDFHLVPYFLKSLADDGWDVVRAKLPENVVGPRGLGSVWGGAQAIRQRVAALKAQGYKRVVTAGHSWGGWAAMLAASDGGGGDAVMLSAPNTFGPHTIGSAARSNPAFHQIVDAFAAALGKDRRPTVLILPDDNVWDPDPAVRGRIAEQYFTQANIPNLDITKPPGFFGHYADWLPIFDYGYGACLRAFLDNPAAKAACAPPPLVNTDFRSIVEMKQLADASARRIAAATPLVGRRFVAYTLEDMDNKHFDYVSPAERVTMESDHVAREQVAFRNGQQCIVQVCSILLRWSDHEILEFDPRSGSIKAWWTEDTSQL
jgi:pimeloyl-ACP methyl ester carboxylesterase